MDATESRKSRVDGTPDRAVPAHVLMFLYADHLIEADGLLTAGTSLPWRNAKVRSKPLAEMVWSAIFWDLRERGIIELAVAAQRKLMRRGPVARARLRRDEPLEGMAGRIIEALRSARCETVKGAVFLSMPSVPNAWEMTAHHATVEAAELGFLTVRTIGKMQALKMAGVGSDLRVEPDLAHIARAERDAYEVARHWRSFTQTEPDLARAIQREASAALRAQSHQADESWPI